MNMTKLIFAAAVAASAFTSVPASAVEEVFANVTATGGRNFRWVRGASGSALRNATFYTTSSAGATSAGAANVLFSLSGAPIPLAINARLTITGSTTNDPLLVTTGGFSQVVDSFNFSIVAAPGVNEAYGPLTINAGDILLSGSVSNARLTGTIGGSTGGALVGSTLGGSNITFGSSPILGFAPGSNYGFTFNLGSVNPVFSSGATTRALASFRSQLGGTFQSDPLPTFVAVPEPGTWAMMIVGMGLVGFARRRRAAAVAA
jgi:hypothetical protein